MEELELIKGDTLVFDFEIEGLKQDLEDYNTFKVHTK